MKNTMRVFVIIFAVIGCICSVAIAKDGIKLQKWRSKYLTKKYTEITNFHEEPDDDEVSQHYKG